jgi:hypothetical protein
MATHTLSTGLSRRSMLLGSALAPSLGLSLLSVLKAIPAPAQPLLELGADAELLQHIAVAERRRNEHARVRRLRDHLRESRSATGPLYPLPFRLRHPALWRLYFDTFERYATAVRAAVAVPAHTIAGAHAKLALATIASRRGGARVYMYEDREWLEIALADLRRIAERSGGASRNRRAVMPASNPLVTT